MLFAFCLDSSPNEAALTILPSNTPNTDGDGDFSLEDLASEYLQNEPTPASSNDKSTPSSESGEPDLTLDDLSKSNSPSSPSTNILLKLHFVPLSNEPITAKLQLESILFPNHLSSHDAADNADCIWKEESSPFGQMFCAKTNEIPMTATKRISTCLLDYSLYERLTRLVNLLPKQCIRNSVQQLSIRHNGQPYRPQRPNNDNRRSSHRPSFQQNSSQAYHMQRFPTPRQYMNYSNQQGNIDGYFVDRRLQQQQNRYPPPPLFFTPNSGDYQHQQKGPPKNNSYAGGYQQPQKKQPTNNQQGSNQRGTKKGSGNGGSGKYSLFVSFYFSFIKKPITKKSDHIFCLTNR